MDENLITAACSYLNIEPEQVLKSRIEGNELVLVVNKGIAGCPKYRLPLAKLVKAPAVPEVETIILGSPKHQDSLVELAKASATPAVETKITSTLGDGVVIVMEEVPPETYIEEIPPEPEAPEDAPEPEATASAVKLAEELGIDLAFVLGTGASGRITKRDVEEFHGPDDS